MKLTPEIIEQLQGYPFNKRIRQIRALLGVTQVEFAKIIGCRQTTVNSWEMGRRLPKPDTLGKIIHKFDLPIGIFNDVMFVKIGGNCDEKTCDS